MLLNLDGCFSFFRLLFFGEIGFLDGYRVSSLQNQYLIDYVPKYLSGY